MSRESGNLLVISIWLSNGDVFESLFESSLENDVEKFIAQTRDFMPKERWYVRD